MYAYLIDHVYADRTFMCFYISEKHVEFPTPREKIVLLIESRRWAMYEGVVRRCCQVELESDDEPKFVKVWVNDPFKGFEGYEQLEDVAFVENDYVI